MIKSTIDHFRKGKEVRHGNISYVPQTHPFPYKPLDTGIKIYERSEDIEDLTIEVSPDFLAENGLGIAKRKPPAARAWKNQQVEYYITDVIEHMVEEIPVETRILYDHLNKRFKLVAMRASPEWFETQSAPETAESEPVQKYFSKKFGIKRQPKTGFQPIKGIVVGQMEDGGILTIPEKLTDPPRMGFVGSAGTGKTTLFSALAGRFYFKQGYKLCFLNDNGQGAQYCRVWETSSSHKTDLDFIHEPRLPLPAVYLHLCNKELSDAPEQYFFNPGGVLGKYFSLSWEEAILNYKEWFGQNKELNLAKASKYLNQMCFDESGKPRHDGIQSIKNRAQIYSFMEEMRHQKMNPNLISSLESALNYMLNMSIFDLTSAYPSKVDVYVEGKKKLTASPLVAYMVAGMVPFVMNNNFRSKQYYTLVLRQMLYDIHSNLRYTGRMILAIDETADIIQDKKIYEVFDMMMRKDRSEGLGVFWVAQSYTQMPAEIHNNTHFLFVFGQRSEEPAKKVCKDMNLPQKTWLPKLLDMLPGYCIAKCNDQRNAFIAYYSDGTVKEINEPKLIRVWPSNFVHDSRPEALQIKTEEEVMQH